MSVQTTEFTPSLRARIGAWFIRAGESLSRAMEMHARVDQIQALQSKSDEELAKLGITRDQIPYHVFRDRAWL
ncbi:hypothetical protein FQV27_03835 [Paracoccus aurantiacus]|uniref:DUF1127 domain-containing protein n=1 Tax=Paracoccus aurantiacus TaxID=2599412 RepID=A0A5C6S956_9RHOB|nr:hypothetical protein [Paracoccus aurantiacus]TXB70986.1 hypothetical protein FQV27_03835 [Paracoccus aurantiacus]